MARKDLPLTQLFSSQPICCIPSRKNVMGFLLKKKAFGEKQGSFTADLFSNVYKSGSVCFICLGFINL